MSTFPALQPSSRSLTPGQFPVNTFNALSGKETRVILGDTPFSHGLALTFSNILEPVMQQILTHFRGQQGTALAFELPAAVYAGWPNYAAEIPLTQKWRYGGPPEVEFVAPGIMNVSVSLVGLN